MSLLCLTLPVFFDDVIATCLYGKLCLLLLLLSMASRRPPACYFFSPPQLCPDLAPPHPPTHPRQPARVAAVAAAVAAVAAAVAAGRRQVRVLVPAAGRVCAPVHDVFRGVMPVRGEKSETFCKAKARHSVRLGCALARLGSKGVARPGRRAPASTRDIHHSWLVQKRQISPVFSFIFSRGGPSPPLESARPCFAPRVPPSLPFLEKAERVAAASHATTPVMIVLNYYMYFYVDIEV